MKWLVGIAGHVLAGHPAELLVELELVNVGSEIADIADIGSYVVLASRVKVVLRTACGGRNAYRSEKKES